MEIGYTAATNTLITGAVLKVQEEHISTPYFSLHQGFVGKFKVDEAKVIKRVVDGKETVLGHRIIGKSDIRRSSIHGSLIAQSFVLAPSEIEKLKELSLVDGHESIYWYEDAAAKFGSTYQEIYPRNEKGEFLDYEYPEFIEILGAAVFTAQSGNGPMVPLFKYPGYKLIRAKHRELLGDDTAKLGYWDAIELVRAGEIDGLRKDFEFTPDPSLLKDPKNFVFRLLIKDPRS